MDFSLAKSLEILEKTPDVLALMLGELSPDWTHQDEGENTWSVFDVIGHLIYADQTDWMLRAGIILSDEADKTFPPFDRFAQFELSKGKTLEGLLQEFREVRQTYLAKLKALNLSEADLEKIGRHPVLGPISLRQLLATWTVHDLTHIVQISRIMAKQYKEAVGPFEAFLGVLK